MIIIPAIDLKEGNCVRLRQGKMDDATVFSNDPVEMAQHWYDLGARRLHLVDLDGAFKGKLVNADIVTEIAKQIPDLKLQIGGGIRDVSSVDFYLDAGVNWVIIGTQAVKDASFVKEVCERYPGRIIVGVDARNGWVAINGWENTESIKASELVAQFSQVGVSAIIYTDIERDGMMQGVNIDATLAIAQASSIPVIASGGVTNMDDIDKLLAVKGSGIFGVITGRAIYEGNLDFAVAYQHSQRNE